MYVNVDNKRVPNPSCCTNPEHLCVKCAREVLNDIPDFSGRSAARRSRPDFDSSDVMPTITLNFAEEAEEYNSEPEFLGDEDPNLNSMPVINWNYQPDRRGTRSSDDDDADDFPGLFAPPPLFD